MLGQLFPREWPEWKLSLNLLSLQIGQLSLLTILGNVGSHFRAVVIIALGQAARKDGARTGRGVDVIMVRVRFR